jgi:hypothetical protein
LQDVLKEMTKNEIINWIKTSLFFRPPKMSDMLFQKWSIKQQKIAVLRLKHASLISSVDLVELDRLKKMENEKNSQSKAYSIFLSIDRIYSRWKKLQAKYDMITQEVESADKIYKAYEAELINEHEIGGG